MTPTITLVGLKDASFESLNSEGHNYLENLMLLNELLKIVSKKLLIFILFMVNIFNIYYLNIQVRVAKCCDFLLLMDTNFLHILCCYLLIL